MDAITRRECIPLLALTIVSLVLFGLRSNDREAGATSSSPLATVAPTEHLLPASTWVDDLEDKLTTYFAEKYPAYDFSPYRQELDRVRSAASRGDRWAAKREMGVFLKMVGSRAYGLADDAAEELAASSQEAMPDEEFAIVYPGGLDPTTDAAAMTW
ncbi:MAG: hypothetical protein AB7G48_04810 [Nitrospiraceae bacterium]